MPKGSHCMHPAQSSQPDQAVPSSTGLSYLAMLLTHSPNPYQGLGTPLAVCMEAHSGMRHARRKGPCRATGTRQSWTWLLPDHTVSAMLRNVLDAMRETCRSVGDVSPSHT